VQAPLGALGLVCFGCSRLVWACVWMLVVVMCDSLGVSVFVLCVCAGLLSRAWSGRTFLARLSSLPSLVIACVVLMRECYWLVSAVSDCVCCLRGGLLVCFGWFAGVVVMLKRGGE
jgi:hypothetical protein